MPQIGRALRLSLVTVLVVAGCGPRIPRESKIAAAPVHVVAVSLAKNADWKAGKCVCVGEFRDDAVQDYPAELTKADFAVYKFLRPWSVCEPFYSRKARAKGCEAGMTDFICSVAVRDGLPKGTTRVLCHVSGQSEALQKAGYLQDEYDVSEQDGALVVKPISLTGTGKIHE